MTVALPQCDVPLNRLGQYRGVSRREETVIVSHWKQFVIQKSDFRVKHNVILMYVHSSVQDSKEIGIFHHRQTQSNTESLDLRADVIHKGLTFPSAL